MSDYDDLSTETNKGNSWLALPSPKALLDRTTKFVLNAAQGKSRSLIPTSDNQLQSTMFSETGVIDWEDAPVHAEEEEEEEGEEDKGAVVRVRRTRVVPEREVLQGAWNGCAIVNDGDSDSEDSGRSGTPPGMVRIRVGLRASTALPPRRRIRPQRSNTQVTTTGVATSTASAAAGPQQQLQRRRIPLISLPPRVIARIFEYLPVAELLHMVNSCRVLRRVIHKHGPGAADSDVVGDAAYTVAGIRLWRVLVQRMGWRVWYERVRGRERRQRIEVPRSHARLLEQICGVEDEAELVDILGTEPDLLFKALFDNMHGDYAAFRSLANPMPPMLWHSAAGRMRSPAEIAERLDQLQWFGRGRFTHDAYIINRRLLIVADKFEDAYRDRFTRAFLSGDCTQMRTHAAVMENIRGGRGCIRLLTDAHPLFSAQEDLGTDAFGADSPYARVFAASDCTSDSHSFGLFLDGLQALVEEHSHVVSLALPPPTLPASALFCFVQALFSPSGVALRTLQKLYAHLRAIPVGTFDTVSVPGTRVAPDEATKDILYLTTVAEVVALLLAAADSWAVMQPVGLPMELGRRCVFGAFEDVIGDYVQLERRIIERAYAESLGRWMVKSKERLNQPPPPSAAAAAAVMLAGRIDAKVETERPRRDSVSSARILGGAAGMESSRTVNFSQRRLQMDEYKARVLKVLGAKLGISLSSEMQGIDGESDDAEGGDAGASLTGVGLTKFDAVSKRWPSGGVQTKPVNQGRTVVGEVLWNSPVSIDLCLNMVLTNRDAIDRLAVFAEAPPGMRLRKLAQEAIESVFCILLQSVGNHVRPAFSKILAELKDLEHTAMVVMVTQKRTTSLNNTRQPVSPSTAPAQTSAATATAKSNFPVYSAQRIQAEKELREKFASVELRFFELIHLSDLVVQMLEIYYKKDMCMFIDESDFLNMCNQEKKALEHAIDDSVAVGMDCVIEVILRQTQHILDTEQHALDYHPDSNISLTLTPSLACTRAVQFLGESTAVLQSMTMQKQMRGVFMGEIGQRLFSVLLDNIKRFQITEPGGFQLIADLNLYYDWAASNVDLDTLRYFTALKDLANCFILAPRDLRGFLRDQYSRRTFDGVMRSEEVYDVVACRADYKQIRTQVEGHCDFM